MENNTPAPSPAPAESQPTPETPSLDDIASTLSVEEQANQFASSVPVQPNYRQPYQQPYQPPQFEAPDPITNPEGYKSYMAAQYSTVNKLNSTLEQFTSKVTAWERTQQEQKINRDVETAVQKVNAKLNVDPEMAEVALELEYRKNPSFKKIWDNRERNPQALEKALDIVSQKLQGKFSVRQDPQIANNLRAAKTSQQSMATSRTPGVNDGIPNDPREFDAFWSRLVNGG